MKKTIYTIIIFCLFAVNGYSQSNIKFIDLDEFSETIFPRMERPVFLFFGRDGCPYVKKMVPIINRLADDFRGRVDFYYVKAMEEGKWLEELDVQGLPWFVLYNGIYKYDYVYMGGPHSYNDIATELNEAINDFQKN